MSLCLPSLWVHSGHTNINFQIWLAYFSPDLRKSMSASKSLPVVSGNLWNASKSNEKEICSSSVCLFSFFFFLQSCSAAGHANGWCWSLTFFQWQYLSSHDRHAHPWGTKAVQMPGTESGAVLKLYMLDMLCTKAATTIGGNNNKASKEEVCYSQRSQRRESVHASQGHR